MHRMLRTIEFNVLYSYSVYSQPETAHGCGFNSSDIYILCAFDIFFLLVFENYVIEIYGISRKVNYVVRVIWDFAEQARFTLNSRAPIKDYRFLFSRGNVLFVARPNRF